MQNKLQALTNGGQYLHGPHGGLDVEPQLLQGQQTLPLEVLQLCDQDQVLLHQGPHGRCQRVVHLAVLKGRLLLNEAEGKKTAPSSKTVSCRTSHMKEQQTFLNAHRVIVE